MRNTGLHHRGGRERGPPPSGGIVGSGSSCMRLFAFLSNMFDGEMTLDEKLVLQILRRLAATPYDKENADHEQLLRRFFLLCFPEATLEPAKEEDSRWKEVGFQSEDPRRDFRGGGFLALQNLCFFRLRYPRQFFTLSRKSYTAGFPMAAAFINITHMLTAYLRLTVSAGLAAGEIQAPRRAMRHFLRLCLSPAALEDEAEERVQLNDFSKGSKEGSFLCPPPLPGAAALAQRRGSDSYSDSDLVRSDLSAASANAPACGMRTAAANVPQGQPTQASSPLPSGPLLPGRRLRRGSSDLGRGRVRTGQVTENRVLTVFGHLFVFACMRLDQELGLRGAWQPDGTDPPLAHSPRHFPHHFSGRRRLHGHFVHSSRRTSASKGSSGKSHPAEETHMATEPSAGSGGASEASRDSVLAPTQGRDTAPVSPARSVAGMEETELCPTSGELSATPSPRSTGSGREQPSVLPANPGAPGDSGSCEAAARPASGGSDGLLHRRAQLCFGEALKEVRNAVDAVLCDGTVQTVGDLGAICRSC
ncbi:ELMO/CED-12 family domain-containing protein, putative [Eimeria tenella]|uniref:ELMO/CED-12 family domain-containing protein, putative n=1 Tax=Eimeria tenella TaxID=5802 RepID=U6KLA5_EIMTE|nr:ELMO/CED-12 family domain-containing protein, putative [Eimeria tenella]CDJ37596.1 ELMO/CED-12 family domain-containing protein, putative [Eimeria tenella]|eukprot:XP_013228434.1 ELMO/CED-12 family domain-containing protein, putative [Eimeria tenella]